MKSGLQPCHLRHTQGQDKIMTLLYIGLPLPPKGGTKGVLHHHPVSQKLKIITVFNSKRTQWALSMYLDEESK